MNKSSAKILSGVRFCPYCGSELLERDEEKFMCMACGGFFGLARFAVPLDHERRTKRMFAARAHTYDDFVLNEISNIVGNLNLPRDIVERASAIYRRAVAEGFVTEKSIPGIVGAALWVACRQGGITISSKKIATAFGVDKKEIEHHHRSLLNEWGYIAPFVQAQKYQPDITRFLEKKGAYAFLSLLKDKPRRWKTLEKEIALSPRSLSERISEALELGLVEKVRRLKIGATYYRLTKKGSEVFEATTESTRIY